MEDFVMYEPVYTEEQERNIAKEFRRAESEYKIIYFLLLSVNDNDMYEVTLSI